MGRKGIAYMTGAQLQSSLPEAGITFDCLAEFSGCWLCGAVYQSPQDRAYYRLKYELGIDVQLLKQLKTHADRLRDEWRSRHSESHSADEHEQLSRSPDLMTVEAAQRLAPLGVFQVEGSKQMMQALREAPRVPEGRIYT